jgi:hypothetical protein
MLATMTPVLEAMNQTVKAGIFVGAEAGDSAVAVDGIESAIMPELGSIANGC